MTTQFSAQRIFDEAEAELEDERFRAAVDAVKARLRAEDVRGRRWWHRFVPFYITIHRRIA